jgi:hypothetical protein
MSQRQTHPNQLSLPLGIQEPTTAPRVLVQALQARILDALSSLILKVGRALRAESAAERQSADERAR